MLILNFSNVEDLIFYDKDLQELLPVDMFSIFEQWRLSKRIPYLKSIGKEAILDFLNLIEENEIKILEFYFKEKIIVEKINYKIVKNVEINLKEEKICEKICDIQEFNYFNTYRDENFLYLTFWR